MPHFGPKVAHAACVLRTVVVAAACVVLQLSGGQAQTLAPEREVAANEVLVFENMRVPRWLAETVVRAAHATRVDPAYMMALADKESSLVPDNKARTSSAEGLFQFIEGTWLDVVRAMERSTAMRSRPKRSRSSRGGRRCPTLRSGGRFSTCGVIRTCRH